MRLLPESLIARFILAWSGMTVCVVAVVGWFSYRGARDQLVRTWRETLEHEGRLAVLRVQTVMDEAVRDAAYLSGKPVVREFANAADESTRARWRTLLEEDYRALLAGKPLYFQVRMIGIADGGRELIRLDQADGRISLAPPDRLQQKGDRDYFRQGLRLAPQQTMLSSVNLNQEYGQVSEPHIPTVRATVPVFTAGGSLFALTVVNLDLRPLLAELGALNARGVMLLLANEAGDYLLHPEQQRTFGTDLGRPDRFMPDAPPPPGAVTPAIEWRTQFTAGRMSGPLLQLRAVCSSAEFTAGLTAARNRALLYAVLAALAGAGVAAALAGWLARRLRRIGDAMTAYEAGQAASLPESASADEISQLISRFHQMAARVTEHVEKLAAARSDAEAAARARDDFLAMMSHEIRTPVNAIAGLLDALERNAPAPRQRPVLSSLQAASANLLSLVNQALDHSRIAAGHMEFDAADFSLPALVEDVALTHRPLAEAKGVTLSATVDPQLPPRLRGDAVRLAQILNNLVSNAVKFTDRGYIRIGAAAGELPDGAEGRIGLLLTVADSGMGIAEEHIGKVFAPFGQTPVSRRFGGTGLGLSIVRSLVEMQGGTLHVDSEPGRGSVFTVWLPIALAAGTPVAQAAPAAAPQFTGLHILCVEDTPSNVEVMKLALAGTGADLVCAEDAAAGLAALDRAPCSIALIDLQLPDMNGIELALHIRQRPEAPPLMAVTAQAAEETRAACMAAGFAAVLIKPYTRAALHAEIARVLKLPAAPAEPPVPEPGSARRLADIFPGEPERVARLARALVAEMEAHESQVATAGPAELARMRHKLHSAIVQLDLTALADALDAAIRAPAAATARLRIREALQSARAALLQESTAPEQDQ